MVAEFKSHVLRREEKGMFGIQFKRLLGAGIGGVILFMIARIIFPVGAIPVLAGLASSPASFSPPNAVA